MNTKWNVRSIFIDRNNFYLASEHSKHILDDDLIRIEMTDRTKTKRSPGRPKGSTKGALAKRRQRAKKAKADAERVKNEVISSGQAVLEGEVMGPLPKRGVGKPKGYPRSGGRVKGVESLDKRTLREQVTRVVDMKAKSISVWIDEVYRNQGPDKALDKVIALMEFALPKLNRTEWTGENGGPVEHELSIIINAVKPPE
jgi:hypothetical protein